MFGKRFKLFKLLGFEVGIDLSWILIAILIAWSLSTGFFPFQYKNLSTQTYWLMGIIGAVGLFFSIIAHEFCQPISFQNVSGGQFPQTRRLHNHQRSQRNPA
jgi:hypothetical protein